MSAPLTRGDTRTACGPGTLSGGPRPGAVRPHDRHHAGTPQPMMTTRRLLELPDDVAAPIMTVVDHARAAADPRLEDTSAWAAAEAGQTRVRTGYKASRRVASAGQLAAHVVRLLAPTDTAGRPWWTVLASSDVTTAIGSWDWDDRMWAALQLRRTYKDGDPATQADAVPVALVATWLTHAKGEALPGATARLCRHVLERDVDEATWSRAWYLVHGLRLVDELAVESRPGRPPADDPHRLALRTAVRAAAIAGVTTKTELAAVAGVTRRTLDAWLSEPVSPVTTTLVQDPKEPR